MKKCLLLIAFVLIMSICFFGCEHYEQEEADRITPECIESSFECYVLAPFHDETHELKAYQFDYGFDFGLPAGVEDLEDFVRNPASRPLLCVQANITLLPA